MALGLQKMYSVGITLKQPLILLAHQTHSGEKTGMNFLIPLQKLVPKIEVNTLVDLNSLNWRLYMS